MANICCDDVIFYTEGNPEGLYDLWEDLETHIILNQNPDLCWIGNLFSHKKIDSTGISLRGNVSYMEWNDTYILLSLETAWTPLYEAYQGYLSGDKNVLYKMKEFWNNAAVMFTNHEKYAKKIRKVQTLKNYEQAVNALFNDQELIK